MCAVSTPFYSLTALTVFSCYLASWGKYDICITCIGGNFDNLIKYIRCTIECIYSFNMKTTVTDVNTTIRFSVGHLLVLQDIILYIAET